MTTTLPPPAPMDPGHPPGLHRHLLAGRLGPDRRRGRLRLVQRAAGPRDGQPDHGEVEGHRADRSVGLRQVDVPAHPQPDARGGPRRPVGRDGQAGRRRHLRARAAGHGDPAPHRHGLPEAEPVPGHDHRRERAGRPQVLAHRPRPTRTTWSRSRWPRAACGTRSRTASASWVAPCPAASSSDCASPGRWPSSPACC